MGNSESDATKIYAKKTLTDTTSTSNNIDWYFNYPPTQTIFYYQILCPNCEEPNWCELDKICTCSCGDSVRAVSAVADYEVAVIKSKKR